MSNLFYMYFAYWNIQSKGWAALEYEQVISTVQYDEYVCLLDDSDSEDTDITVDLERLESLTETDV